MKFDLKTPCSECPFRRDCLTGWLGLERASDIAQTLDGGNRFSCHKTGRNEKRDGEQHCAGALIVLKNSQGGFSGSISVAAALRIFNYRALDLEAPVFGSLDDFIDHHDTAARAKERK